MKALLKGSFRSKALQLLRMERGSEMAFSSCSQREDIHTNYGNLSYHRNLSYHKEYEKAIAEAERDRARAIVESQKRPFIC